MGREGGRGTKLREEDGIPHLQFCLDFSVTRRGRVSWKHRAGAWVGFRDVSPSSHSGTLGNGCFSLGLSPPLGALVTAEVAPGFFPGTMRERKQDQQCKALLCECPPWEAEHNHSFIDSISIFPLTQPTADCVGNQSPGPSLLDCIN